MTTYTAYFCTDWTQQGGFSNDSNGTASGVSWNGAKNCPTSDFSVDAFVNIDNTDGWESATADSSGGSIYTSGGYLLPNPSASELPSTILNEILLFKNDGSLFEDNSGNYVYLSITYDMTENGTSLADAKYNVTLTLTNATDPDSNIFLGGVSATEFSGTEASVSYSTTEVYATANSSSTTTYTSPCAESQSYNGILLSTAAGFSVTDTLSSTSSATIEIIGSSASQTANNGSPFTNSLTATVAYADSNNNNVSYYSFYHNVGMVNQYYSGTTTNSTAGTITITIS